VPQLQSDAARSLSEYGALLKLRKTLKLEPNKAL
jgi:hypothetical protein